MGASAATRRETPRPPTHLCASFFPFQFTLKKETAQSSADEFACCAPRCRRGRSNDSLGGIQMHTHARPRPRSRTRVRNAPARRSTLRRTRMMPGAAWWPSSPARVDFSQELGCGCSCSALLVQRSATRRLEHEPTLGAGQSHTARRGLQHSTPRGCRGTACRCETLELLLYGVHRRPHEALESWYR